MRVFVLTVLCAISAAGQNFEVATLKLSPPPKENRIVINLGRWQTGRFDMQNVTLSDLMKFAYSIGSNAQLVVPEWSNQVRFDVEAKAPPDTEMSEVRLMLRALLDERLHLKLRREQKVLPYLALTKGKSSPKMSAAEPVANPNPGPQVPGRIAHPQMSMFGLASLLSRFE